MKKASINDANIFIDMNHIGALDLMFSISLEIHTTDFVLNELKENTLKEKLSEYEESGRLAVKRFSPDELVRLSRFYPETQNRLSLADRSVWYYAEESRAMLITGDKALRSKAEQKGITVHGILYLWKLLVDEGLLDKESASRKLEHLCSLNKRLPICECNKMIDSWLGTEYSDYIVI